MREEYRINWIPFHEKKPKPGQIIIYANYRGIAFGRYWGEDDPRNPTLSKHATHWYYAEMTRRQYMNFKWKLPDSPF